MQYEIFTRKNAKMKQEQNQRCVSPNNELHIKIPISVLMHTFDRFRIEHTTKLYARYLKRNKMHWSLNISLPI